MRQYKFRGKSLYDYEWIYGNLQIAGDYDQQTYINPYNDYDKFTEVDKNTVCQSTELFDINEKEIFEGDIVKLLSSDLICIIRWHKYLGTFYFDFEEDQKEDDKKLSIGEKIKDIEVIGNVYDNPDLFV